MQNQELDYKDIPDYRYKLKIYNQNAKEFVLQEQKAVHYKYGKYYVNTDKKKIIKQSDFFDFYSSLITFDKFIKKYDTSLPKDEFEQIKKEAIAFQDSFFKNSLFVDEKNNRYTMSLDSGKASLDRIEEFFTNDIFNNIGLIDFEKIVKQYFAVSIDVDYYSGNENGYIVLQNFNIPKDTITEYTCFNINSVFFSILHYYKANGYKIKSCKLCHSLFIADSLKEEYCHNQFVYTDWENKEHIYPQCAGKTGARKKINDKLMCRKKNVYQWLYRRWIEYGDLPNDKSKKEFYDFEARCKEYERKIKENPCIDNFKEYEKYLYMDCDKIYRKYERRWK